MAHPYAEHREKHAGKARAHHLLKGHHARGGKVHSDEAADRKLFKKLINEHEKGESKVEGKKAGGRLDKYARGGRTKKGHKGNHVNIVIANPDRSVGQGAAAPGGAPPILPPAAGGAPMPPMGMPPGGPPGMPPKPPGMMKRGGMVKMRGGADSGVGRLDKVKAYKRG